MNREGFTLIELLVVIAIIALLSGVILASLSTARMKSRDAKRVSDLRQIKIALELYFDANNKYPATGCGYNCNQYRSSWLTSPQVDCSGNSCTGWDLLASDLKPYIPNLPIDPINSKCVAYMAKCYSYSYGNVGDNTSGNAYEIWAQLETPDHPQSCKYQKYRWGTGVYGIGQSKGVCANSGAPFNGTYPDNVYIVNNEVY